MRTILLFNISRNRRVAIVLMADGSQTLQTFLMVSVDLITCQEVVWLQVRSEGVHMEIK